MVLSTICGVDIVPLTLQMGKLKEISQGHLAVNVKGSVQIKMYLQCPYPLP